MVARAALGRPERVEDGEEHDRVNHNHRGAVAGGASAGHTGLPGSGAPGGGAVRHPAVALERLEELDKAGALRRRGDRGAAPSAASRSLMKTNLAAAVVEVHRFFTPNLSTFLLITQALHQCADSLLHAARLHPASDRAAPRRRPLFQRPLRRGWLHLGCGGLTARSHHSAPAGAPRPLRGAALFQVPLGNNPGAPL